MILSKGVYGHDISGKLTEEVKHASAELMIENIKKRRICKYLCIMNDVTRMLDDILNSQRMNNSKFEIGLSNQV